MPGTIISPSGKTLGYATTKTTTPTSQTDPKDVHVKKLKGTIYWGGAGLDGAYIKDQMNALKRHGIKNVYEGRDSDGTLPDAINSGTLLRYKKTRPFPFEKEGDLYSNDSVQFNLIGYSYGSLMAAQTANYYALQGAKIDNLVLVASPISQEFLNDLITNKNIGNVNHININQYGDPIFAGISESELLESAPLLAEQMAESIKKKQGIGHFYFAPDSPEGADRRDRLARVIVGFGLQ